MLKSLVSWRRRRKMSGYLKQMDQWLASALEKAAGESCTIAEETALFCLERAEKLGTSFEDQAIGLYRAMIGPIVETLKMN